MTIHIQRYRPKELYEDVVRTILSMEIAQNIRVQKEIVAPMPDWLEGDASKLRRILISLFFLIIKHSEDNKITFEAYMEERDTFSCLMIMKLIYSGSEIKEESWSVREENDELKTKEASLAASDKGEVRWISEILQLLGGEITTEILPQNQYCIAVKIRQKNAIYDNATFLDGMQALLVSDSKVDRKLLSEYALRLNVYMDMAGDWLTCVECLQRKAYDIIFMSANFTEKSGHELAKIIRKNESREINQIPIVLLCANGDGLEESKQKNPEFSDYLLQPPTILDFKEVIVKSCKNKSPENKSKIVLSDLTKPQEKLPIVENSDYERWISILMQYDINPKEALNSVENDWRFYDSLLKSFSQKTDDMQEHLLDKLHKREFKEYAHAVHSLQINASAIGAMKLSELALQQEKYGDAQESEKIKDTLSEFFSQWNHTNYGITDYFNIKNKK